MYKFTQTIKWQKPFIHLSTMSEVNTILGDTSNFFITIANIIQWIDTNTKHHPYRYHIPLPNGYPVKYHDKFKIDPIAKYVKNSIKSNDRSITYDYPNLVSDIRACVMPMAHKAICGLVRDYDSIESDDDVEIAKVLEIEAFEDQPIPTVQALRMLGLLSEDSFYWLTVKDVLYTVDGHRNKSMDELYSNEFIVRLAYNLLHNFHRHFFDEFNNCLSGVIYK